jgi:hypothetical protein
MSRRPLSPIIILALLLLRAAAVGSPATAGEGGAAALRRVISLRFPGTRWISTERLADWMTATEKPALALLDVETVHPYNRTWGRLLDAHLHPEK